MWHQQEQKEIIPWVKHHPKIKKSVKERQKHREKTLMGYSKANGLSQMHTTRNKKSTQQKERIEDKKPRVK